MEFTGIDDFEAELSEIRATDGPLSTARGIVFGLIFSLPMWLVIVGAAVAALR